RFLTMFALRSADAFVVLSAAVGQELSTLLPGATIRRVHHPVYELFGTGMSKPEARRRLELPEGPLALFFGYIRRYKGLDVLLRALPRIRSEIDLRVVIAGEFYEDSEPYLRAIADLGLTEAVHIRSDYVPNDQVALYFSACDVVILPYRSATQSGIVQIAYQFDVPVITTAVGGLPEVVEDGKTGFVVAPSDDRSLAEAVIRFYRDHREEEFRTAIRAVKSKFSWEALVEAIEELAFRNPSG
ncbi:MAG: glycosyltransferase, partial [Bacteroidota bacterium]